MRIDWQRKTGPSCIQQPWKSSVYRSLWPGLWDAPDSIRCGVFLEVGVFFDCWHILPRGGWVGAVTEMEIEESCQKDGGSSCFIGSNSTFFMFVKEPD